MYFTKYFRPKNCTKFYSTIYTRKQSYAKFCHRWHKHNALMTYSVVRSYTRQRWPLQQETTKSHKRCRVIAAMDVYRTWHILRPPLRRLNQSQLFFEYTTVNRLATSQVFFTSILNTADCQHTGSGVISRGTPLGLPLLKSCRNA